MNENVITLIWGLAVFIVVFLINYLVVFKLRYKNTGKKKKKKDLQSYIGFSYLIPKFNLDKDKIDINYMFFCISLINAFIIAFVFMIVYIIPWSYPFRMIVGFVLLFGLIYSLYEIYGRHLVKKGWRV